MNGRERSGHLLEAPAKGRLFCDFFGEYKAEQFGVLAPYPKRVSTKILCIVVRKPEETEGDVQY